VRGGQLVIESAINEADNLWKVLKRRTSEQVNSADEKQITKATVHTWFNNHRTVIASLLGGDRVKPIDDLYRVLLEASGRSALRNKYFSAIKEVKKKLGALQAEHVIILAGEPDRGVTSTLDTAPKFSPLISDAKMQMILARRWQECSVCVSSNAPLAATVMMGGLLEGLLLAKINQLSEKAPVFAASTAPIDSKTGKTLELKEWGLKNYLDVAYELGWITRTTKDVGAVVRDYRNYIHPQKELSHGIVLGQGDSQMLWEIAKSIALQLLNP
jgi:hypothetical protein